MRHDRLTGRLRMPRAVAASRMLIALWASMGDHVDE
jgi:hypothetical protein